MSKHNVSLSKLDWIVVKGNNDPFALPIQLETMPDWLQFPLGRYLRLKQRNWPTKTVQRSTRQIFSRIHKMSTFFVQNFEWSAWEQLSTSWIEEYIDVRLREGIAPGTVNWDLSNLCTFFNFVNDEGYPVPNSVLKLKFLDQPRRLPRPLSQDQVQRLEKCIQNAIAEAKNDRYRVLAVRDLACFYLLWQCGLRISEVCSLLVHDLDMTAQKILVRNSKERKDRVVYMSGAVAMAIQQYLGIRQHQMAVPLFVNRNGDMLTTRTLQRRLVHYGALCDVPVTAHRLRHTFASQMLSVGMPVTSLQRLLGHEHVDTTMIYAEVADPVLQQDYYRGISAIDSLSTKTEHQNQEQLEMLRQLVIELKDESLTMHHRDEILSQMQGLLVDENKAKSE